MRKLLVAVVLLALLLVVGDRVAASVVEGKLADRIDAHEGVDGAEVDVHGFPFITQVLGNHFGEVEVSLPALDADTAAGSLQVDDVTITLHDLKTADGFTRATARRVTGTGSIPYSQFDQYPQVAVAYGGDGMLEVSAPSLGGRSVLIKPDLADGLTLDLSSLGASSAIPAPIRTFLQLSLDVGGLPDGITVDAIEATESSLDLTLTGRGVDLAR